MNAPVFNGKRVTPVQAKRQNRRNSFGSLAANVELDRRMMRRALALAKRGRGYVEPNPMVGCAMVRNGRIIGEGYHRRFGGPHAEIEALRACEANPRGSTAYVTLEPCSHFGKTPPCVDALVEAGVVRVVTPLCDPNPLVSGSGVRRLRRAGIEVEVGLLADEAAELLAPFLTRVRQGRPYVIAKWAESADGWLATPPGQSKWISCEKSRRWVHRLRARVDAIMVGAGTVPADDPMLTARDVPIRRHAMRIVVDGRLRIPETCRLVKSADQFATIVFTTSRAAQSAKAGRLQGRGVEVVACRARGDRIMLINMLRSPILHDVTNLLVEGGPTLLHAFFAAGVVDEADVFVAPHAIAASGSRDRRRSASLQHAVSTPTPIRVRKQRSGDDLLLRMRFEQQSVTCFTQSVTNPLVE
jgi:diaminohydroxyphosphoribosylaminopyrimidine deaminase/5-amino-6-(5-phosphoribosylamino)uracil reductase